MDRTSVAWLEAPQRTVQPWNQSDRQRLPAPVLWKRLGDNPVVESRIVAAILNDETSLSLVDESTTSIT